MFDPANKVVRLCADGMMAEGEGNPERAADLFRSAWEVAADSFEKAVAAHYVARHTSSDEEELEWNSRAVHYADMFAEFGTDNELQENRYDSRDRRLKSLYPSLYLNLAHSLEKLGKREVAGKWYQSGIEAMDSMEENPYTTMIRKGLEAGIVRIRAV